jgi:hypothetical protein
MTSENRFWHDSAQWPETGGEQCPPTGVLQSRRHVVLVSKTSSYSVIPTKFAWVVLVPCFPSIDLLRVQVRFSPPDWLMYVILLRQRPPRTGTVRMYMWPIWMDSSLSRKHKHTHNPRPPPTSWRTYWSVGGVPASCACVCYLAGRQTPCTVRCRLRVCCFYQHIVLQCVCPLCAGFRTKGDGDTEQWMSSQSEF